MTSSDAEKLKSLNDMVETPESIYLYLMMDADYRRRFNMPKLSDQFIEKAYDLMALTVKPEAEPGTEQTEMPGVPEQEKVVGKGTLIPLMGRDPTPEEMEEEPVQGDALEEVPEPGKAPKWKPTAPTPPTAPSGPKPVESPLQKDYVPPLAHKQREIAKKLRPWLTKSAASRVLKNFFGELYRS